MLGFFLEVAGIFPLLVGIVTVGSWVLPLKQPADESNRINRVILWWYTIRSPEMFVEIFPWLEKDVKDNLEDNKK